MLRFILSTRRESWTLEEIESQYLFDSILHLGHKYGVSILELQPIELSTDKLHDLIRLLEGKLDFLLNEYYSVPPPRHRQRHPGYYSQFNYKGNKYIVNYTTSIVGRLMYLIFIRIQMAKKAVIDQSTMTLAVELISE